MDKNRTDSLTEEIKDLGWNLACCFHTVLKWQTGYWQETLFKPGAIPKLDLQWFLLSVAFSVPHRFPWLGHRNLWLELKEHSICLNVADPLTVIGSADITQQAGPHEMPGNPAPPLSQSSVIPGEEQPSTCSAWLMQLLSADSCWLQDPRLLLRVTLPYLQSYFDLDLEKNQREQSGKK